MPVNFKLTVRRTRGRWTPETLRLAFDMARAGSSNLEIAPAVGMSVASVNLKLMGMERPHREKHQPLTCREYVSATERAPKIVFEERERRAEAADRRDYTQTFLGDPPPGYSALDQKRAGA